jgi:hypothetical protein
VPALERDRVLGGDIGVLADAIAAGLFGPHSTAEVEQ